MAGLLKGAQMCAKNKKRGKNKQTRNKERIPGNISSQCIFPFPLVMESAVKKQMMLFMAFINWRNTFFRFLLAFIVPL